VTSFTRSSPTRGAHLAALYLPKRGSDHLRHPAAVIVDCARSPIGRALKRPSETSFPVMGKRLSVRRARVAVEYCNSRVAIARRTRKGVARQPFPDGL
jgi:hypothetical protein